jgi:hypothetical protein
MLTHECGSSDAEKKMRQTCGDVCRQVGDDDNDVLTH